MHCCTSTRRASCSPRRFAIRCCERRRTRGTPSRIRQPGQFARIRIDDAQCRWQQAVCDDRGRRSIRSPTSASSSSTNSTPRPVSTGRTFTYAKDSSDFITGGVNNSTSIFVTGDMTHVAGDRYIMIERDDFQGPPNSANPPRQKKLYLFDLTELIRQQAYSKRLLVDLLDIDDPRDIGGPLIGIPADRFNFPLQSVESVTPVDDFTLLVGLDNNYPGNGRVPGLRTAPRSSCCAHRCHFERYGHSRARTSLGARNGKDDPRGGAGCK